MELLDRLLPLPERAGERCFLSQRVKDWGVTKGVRGRASVVWRSRPISHEPYRDHCVRCGKDLR